VIVVAASPLYTGDSAGQATLALTITTHKELCGVDTSPNNDKVAQVLARTAFDQLDLSVGRVAITSRIRKIGKEAWCAEAKDALDVLDAVFQRAADADRAEKERAEAVAREKAREQAERDGYVESVRSAMPKTRAPASASFYEVLMSKNPL